MLSLRMGVSVADAQLASLVSSGLGAATGAAISCKSQISKGISSIFGSGDGGSDDQSDAQSNISSLNVSGPSSSSADGPLDSVTTGGTETDIGGTSAFSDPATDPGLNLGTSPTVADSGSDTSGGLSGISGPTASSEDDPNDYSGDDIDDEGEDDGLSDDSAGSSSVPVNDKKLEDNVKTINTSTAATTKKLTCTNAIEKAAAQTILKQLTTSTVNWINHGFQGGGPLFVGDPGSFFKNIQDQIVKSFATVISSDAKNYPFGANTAQQLATTLTTSFEQADKYSLDQIVAQQVPGATANSFQSDFATGGWDAFLGLANSNNNPYGFNFDAQHALSIRTTNSANAADAKAQLQRNGGLLDLKQCVSPANYDPKTMDSSACTKWQTVTPGSAITSQLNDALGTPFKQLEDGTNLNADLTAVFNALTNQLITTGLSSLSNSKSSTAVTYTNNGSYAPNVAVGDAGNPTDFLSAGNAYETNIFNLDPSGLDPTDPTGKRVNLVGLIDREQLMVPTTTGMADSLAQNFGWTTAQEATWVTTITATDPNYRNILGRQINLSLRLIPSILELDYCIPGPHPTWQNDSAATVQNFVSNNSKLPQTTASLPSWVTSLPLIGSIIGGIQNASADQRNESAYAGILGQYLGISVNANSRVNGYASASKIISTLYSRYATLLAKAYTPLTLNAGGYSPALVAEDTAEFDNIPTYVKGINDNTATIASTQATIAELISLGKSINALETDTPSLAGYPSPAPASYDDYQAQLTAIAGVTNTSKLTDYQRALKRINDTFNLLAPDLLSDTDITSEDAALDAVSNKLEDIAGTGGDIEQCTADAAAQTAGPVGRRPFPASLMAYLPASFVAQFPSTSSFLPDYYYGQGQAAGELAVFAQRFGFQQDPNKTVQNDDIVTIDGQPKPLVPDANGDLVLPPAPTDTGATDVTAGGGVPPPVGVQYPLSGLERIAGIY